MEQPTHSYLTDAATSIDNIDIWEVGENQDDIVNKLQNFRKEIVIDIELTG